MPVSESEKFGVSVLGCCFSEKTEHVPIKKRRFLFRTQSPPHNTPSLCLEGTEKHGKSNASSQGFQLNTNANCLPAVSASVIDIVQTGNSDNKTDVKGLVKTSAKTGEAEDFSGNNLRGDLDLSEDPGVVSSGSGSLAASIAVGPKEDILKYVNMPTQETGSCTFTALSEGTMSSTMDLSLPDKNMLGGSYSQVHSVAAPQESKKNQDASKTQESSSQDDRLHWDLNTVMDAWEQPLECQHDISPAEVADSKLEYAEEKQGNKEGNSNGCELGRECGGVYDDINKALALLELRSLANEVKELKMEECKSDGHADISGAITFKAKLLCSEAGSAPNVVVKQTESLPDEHLDSADDDSLAVVSNKLNPAHPTSSVSAKDPITEIQTVATITSRSEIEKENFSLTTVAFPENGACDSGYTLNEDDGEARRKSALTSYEIDMKNLVSKGSGLPLETDLLDDVKENAFIDSHQSVLKVDILTTSGAFLDAQSAITVESNEQLAAVVSSIKDTAEPDTEVHTGAENLSLTTTSGKSMTLLTGTNCPISHDADTKYSNDFVSCSNKGTLEVPLDNGFGSDNSQRESGIDKLDDLSVDYDSQYEDGELRESSIHTWEGYKVEDGETEYGLADNRGTSCNFGIVDAQGCSFQYGPEAPSRISVADAKSGSGLDVISSSPHLRALLPEKLLSGEQGSGSGSDEMVSGNGNNGRQDDLKDASLSAEWKMDASRWTLFPESFRSLTGNATKFSDCSSRKIPSWIQKNGMETEDLETKVEGSRLYRRESLSRIGGPSSSDEFLGSSRFRMQGCSSSVADDSTSRSARESAAFRSFGRGRYSPRFHSNGRGGDTCAHSPERDRCRKRRRSPYPDHAFRRSGLEDVASFDNIRNEGGMEHSDAGRETTNPSSHVNRRTFRSRSPTDRENGFRTFRDTSHDRFLTGGRGRSERYGSVYNSGGPRGRYHGPASDDCSKSSLEYSHPFPRRHRCFSPIEIRGHPYAHRRSISRSPSLHRTRSPTGSSGFRRRSSKSPNFRSDTRMHRPRSPNHRRGFDADSPLPDSRWLYKKYPVLDRVSPGRIHQRGERYSFYDSPRKVKQNEHYRSGHPGRFDEPNGVKRCGRRSMGNDDDRINHGYRRGSMRRYDIDGPVKHFHYNDEDSFGSGYDSRDKDASEFHQRGNPKSYSKEIDSRIGDFPRRSREYRDPLMNRRDGIYIANSKSLGANNGIDSRIGDFPRKSGEDRDPLINRRDGIYNAESKSLGARVDDFPRKTGEDRGPLINQTDGIYNAESSSLGANNGIDSRTGDLPRKAGEDTDPLINQTDGIYNAESNPLGADYGIDGRIDDFPSKSGEGRDPLINPRDGIHNADAKSLGVWEEDVASSKIMPS